LVGENVERQGGREGRLVRREERRQGGRERREGRERGRGVVRTRGPCVGGPCRRLRSRGPARSRRIHNLLPRCRGLFCVRRREGRKRVRRWMRRAVDDQATASQHPCRPLPLSLPPYVHGSPLPLPCRALHPPRLGLLLLVVSVLVHQLIQLALDFLHVRALNAATLLLTPVDEQN